jgi:hypothetical protein
MDRWLESTVSICRIEALDDHEWAAHVSSFLTKLTSNQDMTDFHENMNLATY